MDYRMVIGVDWWYLLCHTADRLGGVAYCYGMN